MSRATPDDQLKFLLNCVKHSNNGKIDFIEVAKECGIVSKGAAAKRYERLMKTNGIHPNGGPSTTPPPPVAKSLSKTAIAKASAAKKRKIEGISAPRMKQNEEDDEPIKPKLEPFSYRTAYSTVKAEPVANPVMPLPATEFALSSNLTAAMEHAPHQQHFDGANSIFEEFCIPEMFTQHSFEEALVKAEPQPRPQPQPEQGQGQEQEQKPTPPQQPRYIPPSRLVMAQCLEQSSNSDGWRESGKGPLESIIIAD